MGTGIEIDRLFLNLIINPGTVAQISTKIRFFTFNNGIESDSKAMG
jgi:hypothetical protein